jgi:hypothetical protein
MIFHWPDHNSKLLYVSAYTSSKLADLLESGMLANYMNSNKDVLELRDKNYTVVVTELKEIRRHTSEKYQTNIAKFLQDTNLKYYNQLTIMANVRQLYELNKDKYLDEFNIVGGNYQHQCLKYILPGYSYQNDLFDKLQDNFFVPKKFEKKILFFNSRMRLGRYILFYNMFKKFGFDNFYFSTFKDNSTLWERFSKKYNSFQEFLDHKSSHINEIKDINNLNSFLFNLGNGNIPESGKVYNEKQELCPPYSIYNNIVVEVVQETLSDSNLSNKFDDSKGICFNEKTIKTMFGMRPFICNANQGYLKNLHSLGFKTFSNWWDESYDNEFDFYSKQDKIFRIIESILKKSDLELRNMLEDMKPVLVHNFNLAKKLVVDKELRHDRLNLKYS